MSVDGQIIDMRGMTSRMGGTEAECYHLTVRVSLEDGERLAAVRNIEINKKEYN